jgi:hypothetical protein
MTQTTRIAHVFGPRGGTPGVAHLQMAMTVGREPLVRIANKIARTRRPAARSDIPAGAAFLAQFVALDLAPAGTHAAGESGHLDLGIVYGGGPGRYAACYQVPAEPGAPRVLLRVGRVRPNRSAPAWGALRDLPRVACPHLDTHAADSRTEVLVPDARSDSNLVLGQIHVLWSLLHNAVASRLAGRMDGRMDGATAFATAQRVVRGIYRDVVRHDVLGTWLMPGLRERYTAASPDLLSGAGLGAPDMFLDGVARLGHGLVPEIVSLNARRDVVGLRTLLRQTGSGRPHEMPLTEDWLVDFSRFFDIESPAPQFARAIGPHVGRPFATGGAGAGGAADCLVLRDLIACTRGKGGSTRSLISQTAEVEPNLFGGCFAEDETVWRNLTAEWLSDTGLGAGEIEELAGDPPLTLFLMLEAEADTGGRTLGALGSVLMGEALAAALPAAEDDAAVTAARRAVFGGDVPASMAGLVRFLQDHYRFPDGARLHPPGDAVADSGEDIPQARDQSGETSMFDIESIRRQPIARIEVADYIELGRVVAQWATEPATRPTTVSELRLQLDGIAVIPDRIRTIEFTQGSLDHLVLALPAPEVVEESLERVTDPLGDGEYPLPQFYADHYRPGFGPVMTPLDTLLARVADYTIAQCR